MFIIKNTIVSRDLIERFFVCDLKECKGQCCIEGDAGAPLEAEEQRKIEKNLKGIREFLTPGGEKAIDSDGVAYYDEEGDLVTTLIEGKNCAFTFYNEEGICLCALEKGFREGKLPCLKPESCALYPVRLSRLGEMTALNFHRWKLCGSAEKKGKSLGIRAYQFLKQPLVNKFGKEWYEELDKIAQEWLRQQNEERKKAKK